MGDNRQEISDLKSFLMQKFETKDLERPKYFLVIEVAHSSKGIFLSQEICGRLARRNMSTWINAGSYTHVYKLKVNNNEGDQSFRDY